MELTKNLFNKTYNTILNDKTKKYYNDLSGLENLNISDFALYTPVNSIQRFLARYELMKMVQNVPGEAIAVLEEIGTKYKFVNLLNSHINYCIIE